MPPKHASKLSQIVAGIKQTTQKRAKEEQKGMVKAQAAVAKGPYKPQIPRNITIVKEKANIKELRRISDNKFFSRLSKIDVNEINDRLTDYITENPGHKVLQEIQHILSAKAIKKLAREYAPKNEFLDVFWETYKETPAIKEAIAIKQQEDDELYEMKKAMGEEPEEKPKLQGKEKHLRVKHTTMENRIIYSCTEEMRRGNWLDIEIKDTWIRGPRSRLEELGLMQTNLFGDELITTEYDDAIWYKTREGYFQLLCNPNVNITWKRGKMYLAIPDQEKVLRLRVLYTTNGKPFEQTEDTFKKFIEYRERVFSNKVCVKEKKHAPWMKQPIKHIYISPVTENQDISPYVMPDTDQITEFGDTWYQANNVFYRLLCNRFSSQISQSGDVLTLYLAENAPVEFHVAYMTRTGSLIVQDEAIFENYVNYINRPRVNEECLHLWRQVPWISLGRVQGIYLKPIGGSDISSFGTHINNKKKLHANNEFFRIMCDNNVKKKQVGNVLEITIDNKIIRMQVAYKLADSGKYLVQDERIYAKMLAYSSSRSTINQKKIAEFMSSPVSTFAENLVSDKILYILHANLPNVIEYTPISGGYTESIKEIVNSFDHSNMGTFIKDYANLAVFLSPSIQNISNGVFVSRLGSMYYQPKTLGKLTYQAKLPEIFEDPSYPVDRKLYIEKILEREIGILIRNTTEEIIEGPIDPSKRKPTRPTREVASYLPLSCINSIDMQGKKQQDIVYYNNELGAKYCLLVSDVLDSIIKADGTDEPIIVNVTISGKIVSIILSSDFIEKIKNIHSVELTEKRLENPDLLLSKKFETQITEKPVSTDIELAPGLIEIIMENIRELEEENEDEYNPGEDPEGDKIKQYPCWYCAKLIRGEGTFKTIVYSDKGAVEARFCTQKCLEKQEDWPMPREPKVKKIEEKEAKEEEKEVKEEAKGPSETSVFGKTRRIVRLPPSTKKAIVKQVPKQLETNPKKLAEEIYEDLKEENALDINKPENETIFNMLLESKVWVKSGEDNYDKIKQEIEQAYITLRKEQRGLSDKEKAIKKRTEEQEKAFKVRQKGEKKGEITIEQAEKRIEEQKKEKFEEMMKQAEEDKKAEEERKAKEAKEAKEEAKKEAKKGKEGKEGKKTKEKVKEEKKSEKEKEEKEQRKIEKKQGKEEKLTQEEEKMEALLKKVETLEKKSKKQKK